LFCRRELLETLPFPKLLPAPDYAPEVAETGTQNHEGIVGAAAAVDFLASLAPETSPSLAQAPSASPAQAPSATLAHGASVPLEQGTSAALEQGTDPSLTQSNTRRERLRVSFDALHARGAELTRLMWEGLSEIEGVKLYGPAPDAPRTPTVALTVARITSTEVARRLASRGLFVSHGDFYAATVVERLELGEEGLVRAGCACYTTREEVERLVAGVSEIARGV
jgi:selenocysteine lyase/cysteine desulfurase